MVVQNFLEANTNGVVDAADLLVQQFDPFSPNSETGVPFRWVALATCLCYQFRFQNSGLIVSAGERKSRRRNFATEKPLSRSNQDAIEPLLVRRVRIGHNIVIGSRVVGHQNRRPIGRGQVGGHEQGVILVGRGV